MTKPTYPAVLTLDLSTSGEPKTKLIAGNINLVLEVSISNSEGSAHSL